MEHDDDITGVGEVLREAVQTLERTRTSVKRKALGTLRRPLESLLSEVPR